MLIVASCRHADNSQRSTKVNLHIGCVFQTAITPRLVAIDAHMVGRISPTQETAGGKTVVANMVTAVQ